MVKMELINYASAALIVALGILCGVVLGYVAKEELRPGKKYLAIFQNILLALMLVLLLYLKSRPYIAVLFAFVFLLTIYENKLMNPLKIKFYYLVYAVFALLFFESSRNSFIAHSALMFLYGFPAGSLIFMKKGWLKHALPIAVMFLVLSLLLFFII